MSQRPQCLLDRRSCLPLDAFRVPRELHGLMPIVQAWGAVAGEEERYRLADAAEADETLLAELERVPKLWTAKAAEAFEEWSDRETLTDSYEMAKFYFTFLLLDELSITLPSHQSDPIAALVSDLRKTKGVAAGPRRMFAARHLAERGPEARAALDALRSALDDPLPEVRAWVCVALAFIQGDVEPYRSAIRQLLAEQDHPEIARMYIESALEELDRPPDERAIRRLLGAAITNDLETIAKLVRMVDVNRPDSQDNRTALDLAIGNDHPEAVALLLQGGADPNQRDRFGDQTALHQAAHRRRGGPIIELLLKHGADPGLKDKKGRTPLDVAREEARKANIRLLEAVTGTKPDQA